MILRAAVALLLVTATAAPAQVRGRIVDARTGDGVSGAFVHLVSVAREHVATTSPDGRYVFQRLAPGEYRVRISHPGYEEAALRVVLGVGRDVLLDVPLTLRPVPVARIVVAGERGGGAAANGGAAIDTLALVRNGRPGASLGLQSASALADMVAGDMAREPPPEEGGRRPHVLYIWGSSAERGRVLVDGASVNAPLHLGALLPPIDPDLLASAELRSGGISPRYDGGTAYIMDFTTRSAAAAPHRGWGEADLLVSRIGFAARNGEDGGVIFGARRVNDELVDLLLGRPFGYEYADALARADASLGTAGHLGATLLATREAIEIPRDFGRDEAAWHNLAAALAWTGDAAAAGRRTLRLTASRGVAGLPLLSLPGGHVDATMDRLTATLEQRWTLGRARGVAGFELEHLRFQRRGRADEDPADPGDAGPIECVGPLPCFVTASSTLAAFVEHAWQPGARISARTGLRASVDPRSGRVDLLPRVSLTSMLAGNAALTLSAGRFSQAYAALPGESFVLDTPSAAALPLAAADVALVHATHLEANVARRSARSALAASIFIRHYEAGSDSVDARTTPGLDVSWGFISHGTTVSVGYTVTSNRLVSGDGYLLHHLAGVGVGGSRGPFRFNASTAYGHGMPLTSIVLDRSAAEPTVVDGTGTPPPASRATRFGLPPARAFVRVDAALGAEWRLRWSGRELAVVPYAKIVNALGQRDALFYYHEAGAPGEPRPLAALPAIPVVGVRWQF